MKKMKYFKMLVLLTGIGIFASNISISAMNKQGNQINLSEVMQKRNKKNLANNININGDIKNKKIRVIRNERQKNKIQNVIKVEKIKNNEKKTHLPHIHLREFEEILRKLYQILERLNKGEVINESYMKKELNNLIKELNDKFGKLVDKVYHLNKEIKNCYNKEKEAYSSLNILSGLKETCKEESATFFDGCRFLQYINTKGGCDNGEKVVFKFKCFSGMLRLQNTFDVIGELFNFIDYTSNKGYGRLVRFNNDKSEARKKYNLKNFTDEVLLRPFIKKVSKYSQDLDEIEILVRWKFKKAKRDGKLGQKDILRITDAYKKLLDFKGMFKELNDIAKGKVQDFQKMINKADLILKIISDCRKIIEK